MGDGIDGKLEAVGRVLSVQSVIGAAVSLGFIVAAVVRAVIHLPWMWLVVLGAGCGGLVFVAVDALRRSAQRTGLHLTIPQHGIQVVAIRERDGSLVQGEGRIANSAHRRLEVVDVELVEWEPMEKGQRVEFTYFHEVTTHGSGPVSLDEGDATTVSFVFRIAPAFRDDRALAAATVVLRDQYQNAHTHKVRIGR